MTTEHSDCEITVVFIPTIEIARTLSRYKNSILKFNPRSYLEQTGVNVNDAIRATIENKTTNEFAILNNGITMLSDDTRINERIGQKNIAQLIVTNPQIINGGQTAYTLGRIYEEHGIESEQVFANKEVMLKIITILESENGRATDEQRLALIEQISTATNQQTAVAKADRISNEKIYLDIQQRFFDKYGLVIERKRGEFTDGLHKSYIRENDIVERNKLFRIYFAIIGNITEGTSKKPFLQCTQPEALIADEEIMRRIFFGLKCLSELIKNRGAGNRMERDRKVVASIYALSQNLPSDVDSFDNIIMTRISEFPAIWSRFIEGIIKDTNYQYLKTETDIQTGAKVVVLNSSKLYKSGFFETRVRSYFHDYPW
ncbi:MAG: AIPR family protein [Acidobacteriaceae bacterium]